MTLCVSRIVQPLEKSMDCVSECVATYILKHMYRKTIMFILVVLARNQLWWQNADASISTATAPSRIRTSVFRIKA